VAAVRWHHRLVRDRRHPLEEAQMTQYIVLGLVLAWVALLAIAVERIMYHSMLARKQNFSTAVPTQEQRYMSLELALEKTTAALNALNETLGRAKLQAHPEQPSKAATKAQAEPAPAKVPTPEAIAANAAAEAAKAAAPDYEKVVNPLILKCAQVTTKATAISILGTFTSAAGTPCSNGKHVKPEDYSALMVKLNAAIDAASGSNDTLV
jgi:hypothetical protein